MTRIRRIMADKAKKISVNPLNPRHPRSINPYTDMKTTLVVAVDPCEAELSPHFTTSCFQRARKKSR